MQTETALIRKKSIVRVFGEKMRLEMVQTPHVRDELPTGCTWLLGVSVVGKRITKRITYHPPARAIAPPAIESNLLSCPQSFPAVTLTYIHLRVGKALPTVVNLC